MNDFAIETDQLVQHVIQLDEDKVLELAEELLQKGIDPLKLLEILNRGMNGVGKLYESKDYYIADLIMAGLIFRQVLELDQVTARFNAGDRRKVGRVLLGTVKGDIHDIGKDIFRGMLEAAGFDVADLGVDVSPRQFIEKCAVYRPHIVGLSGVLTSTVDSMKETIEAFAAAGLKNQTKFIVGGNHLTPETCRFVGADGFANDASTGVKKCLEWVGDGLERGEPDHE